MRILVTGGGGYLGVWVTRKLLEEGCSVRIFDRFCYGHSVLDTVSPSPLLEVIQGDIRRLQDAPQLFEGVDAVIHLAGLANDPSCDLDPEMALDVNVESTVELAKQAMQAGVSRFVFASSCAVYGQGVFELLDEESPANPVSTFGKTKLQAEQALLSMNEGDFEPVVLRLATLFGWSPRMRFDLAINQMVATAMRQQRIIVRGGGEQWRPFLHVQDAAECMSLLVQAPVKKVRGEIFNVGADEQNIRIRALAEKVADRFSGVTVEAPKDDDDLRTYRVQFSKIEERLGFKCTHGMVEGIDEIRVALENAAFDPFSEEYFNAKRMKQLMQTPVDQGGEPVAARFIPLAKPYLGKEEEEAILKALRSGWLTSGPQVNAFEKAFCDTVEAKACVGVSSCTAALHLCLVDLGVKPGDEVITSPLTWASTGNTILNMGAKVVFADIDPTTMNITAETVERAITERTRVIMPVDLAGHPCDLDALRVVSQRHGIPIVEDAAHALGASYKGAPIGSVAPMTCFSFYAIKNITTMEGGMIALNDVEQAKRLQLLATNGMSASAWDRYGRSAVPHPPEVVTPGYKYALGNVSAAIGLEQLKKLDDFMAARKRLAHMYTAVLSELDEIELPIESADIESAWHLYIVRFHLDKLNKTRDELAYALRCENIGTGFHFHGLHLHQYYRERLGMRPEDYPVATRECQRLLSLPLHPQLTDKNVHEVVSALKKVLHHAKK